MVGRGTFKVVLNSFLKSDLRKRSVTQICSSLQKLRYLLDYPTCAVFPFRQPCAIVFCLHDKIRSADIIL